MAQIRDDLSRSLTALDQDSTLIAVVELSAKTWLTAGLVPGVSRQPLKKLAADPQALLTLLHRWSGEAAKAGKPIQRIAVGFEAGRDGMWLARWLRARGVEAYVIHASSIAVSREHRRAKTDRLDTESLKRVFLGWLRGEKLHCRVAAIPTVEQEDQRRAARERQGLVNERTGLINRMKAHLVCCGIKPSSSSKLWRQADELVGLRTAEGEPIAPLLAAQLHREVARLLMLDAQIAAIERERLERLRCTSAPECAAADGQARVDAQARAGAVTPSMTATARHARVALLMRVYGLGVETADRLVNELFWRAFHGQRAVGRAGGLTGAPDESGGSRREKGLARSGNASVRHAMIQFAWRFLMFQKNSALAQWYWARVKDSPRRDIRKTMIVALARKLLIVLWRLLKTGEVPADIVMRAA